MGQLVLNWMYVGVPGKSTINQRLVITRLVRNKIHNTSFTVSFYLFYFYNPLLKIQIFCTVAEQKCTRHFQLKSYSSSTTSRHLSHYLISMPVSESEYYTNRI